VTVPILEAVARADLRHRCKSAVDAGARMQMAYAWFPDGPQDPEVRYVVHAGTREPLQVWRCRPGSQTMPSLAAVAPLLSWYEREITDLCGLQFEDQPQPESLVLLPGATMSTPPLLPGVNAALSYVPAASTLPEMGGSTRDDVQLLPFGPVRADVLESAQFNFYYIGEAILHYHPQLFFKHRGHGKAL
jgi:formate hydrogenlyase subunit 5